MKQVTIKGFITHTSYPWAGTAEWGFLCSENDTFDGTQYTVALRPHSITVEVPEEFDPTAKKIAALEAQMTRIQKAAFEECQKVQEEIAKLQSITYTPAGVVDNENDIPF